MAGQMMALRSGAEIPLFTSGQASPPPVLVGKPMNLSLAGQGGIYG
jgi:hypothetical protein